INQVTEEKIQVAIHPEYPKQTVAIGSTLTEEGRKELCAEHRLNIRKGCLPVRQKKKGQAPERNNAIYEEVEKLVDAGIMKEVHYHSWLSNSVMVKKHDDSRVPLRISVQMFPGRMQRVPSNTNGKRRRGKDDIYHMPRNIMLLKMPFGQKNAGATYQRLVDKAFQKQIGQNLEVYVDDLVIKSRTKKEVIRDIREMFKTLREINMKLNPKKSAFRMRKGTFMGYKVDTDRLRVRLDKVEAVLNLPFPKCLKDVQKLNGKLASLNRFLSKSAKKSLPFFKTLKKCTKKSDFQWTAEAEMAFKQMKRLIAELPMLTAPKEKEELIMYLAATKESISAVLMTERDGKQMPIYFVSRALQGLEINYTLMEKLILALEDDTLDTIMEDKEELPYPWILFTDGSSCIDSSGAGLIITNPKEMEFTYALRFRFNATNNEAEYEALIAGLWIAEQMGRKLFHKKRGRQEPYAARQANYVLREIHEGSCSMHAGPRSVVAKALRFEYYWPTMYTDARSLIRECSSCQVYCPVPRNPQQKLTPITSPWPFHKWEIDIAGPFSEGPGLGEGIMARLGEKNKNWVEEISHVLWAHRTMIKSSNGEAPFLLTYGTEAVILVEIGMPTIRTAEVDMIKNDEALEINLDLLEEKREQATIQEAKSKSKMEKYYNARVRSISFRPGDLVYQNNEASRAKDGGKLGPKWEGPYEVTKALGKRAYRLRDCNGNALPRTWNVFNLKKCYVLEM
ncbi:reverse transcriptase domain-containing protein, partial [Tanacetum coccineum]